MRRRPYLLIESKFNSFKCPFFVIIIDSELVINFELTRNPGTGRYGLGPVWNGFDPLIIVDLAYIFHVLFLNLTVKPFTV